MLSMLVKLTVSCYTTTDLANIASHAVTVAAAAADVIKMMMMMTSDVMALERRDCSCR